MSLEMRADFRLLCCAWENLITLSNGRISTDETEQYYLWHVHKVLQSQVHQTFILQKVWSHLRKIILSVSKFLHLMSLPHCPKMYFLIRSRNYLKFGRIFTGPVVSRLFKMLRVFSRSGILKFWTSAQCASGPNGKSFWTLHVSSTDSLQATFSLPKPPIRPAEFW